ncbi:MAG TPA: hypothetical protein EYG06_03315 [Myxococcales bacterium]|nr:hypothetical protein [Myxococcales bacterium]
MNPTLELGGVRDFGSQSDAGDGGGRLGGVGVRNLYSVGRADGLGPAVFTVETLTQLQGLFANNLVVNHGLAPAHRARGSDDFDSLGGIRLHCVDLHLHLL